MEELRDYYLSWVSIEYDDYTGVLIIKSEGFDPKMSQALTSMLVHEGELFMNEMAHTLARDQVEFLEKQVSQLAQEAIKARRAVLSYQNRNGMVSPQAPTETISNIADHLEAHTIELETQPKALKSY